MVLTRLIGSIWYVHPTHLEATVEHLRLLTGQEPAHHVDHGPAHYAFGAPPSLIEVYATTGNPRKEDIHETPDLDAVLARLPPDALRGPVRDSPFGRLALMVDPVSKQQYLLQEEKR